MHHIAIMKKSWGLTEKISSGEKTIESRWYSARRAPWDGVHAGDTIYFKNSGEPVRMKADVEKVIQFELTGPKEVKKILDRYGRRDGIAAGDIPKFFAMFKNKTRCVLMFLRNAKPVKPFDIDKRGFGAMAAWMTVSNIISVKRS